MNAYAAAAKPETLARIGDDANTLSYAGCRRGWELLPAGCGLENRPELERHTVVPNVNMVCHLQCIRQFGIGIAADDKALHGLPIRAEILLNPSHVTKHLAHHCIGWTVLRKERN